MYTCRYTALTHSLAHSLTHSLTRALTHSLTRALTHSLTRALTHSPRQTYAVVQAGMQVGVHAGTQVCRPVHVVDVFTLMDITCSYYNQ